MWFITHHEVEWGFASSRVGLDVVDEFGHRGLVSPFGGVGSAEYSEIGFNFLVYSFGFSVSLRVVCGR